MVPQRSRATRAANPGTVIEVLTPDFHGKEECLRAVDWHDYEPRMHALLRRQYGKGAVQLRDAARGLRDAINAVR
mgnify:CR=1 FL=1